MIENMKGYSSGSQKEKDKLHKLNIFSGVRNIVFSFRQVIFMLRVYLAWISILFLTFLHLYYREKNSMVVKRLLACDSSLRLLVNQISFAIVCRFRIDQSNVSSILWYNAWDASSFHFKT